MNCSGTVRINPVGAIFIGLVVILIVYFNFGQSGESILAYKAVSLKSLLAASIEIAKRGGAEVKAIREQVLVRPCRCMDVQEYIFPFCPHSRCLNS